MRTCKCEIEEDIKYFGSFTDKSFNPKEKYILCECSSREQANYVETSLLKFFKVVNNPLWVNKIDFTPVQDIDITSQIVKNLWDQEVYKYRKTNSEEMKRHHKEGNFDHVYPIFTKAGQNAIEEIKKDDPERVYQWCKKGSDTYWNNMTEEKLQKRSEKVKKGVSDYWNKGEGLLKRIKKLEKDIEVRKHCLENNISLKVDKPLRKESRTKMFKNVQRLEKDLVRLKLMQSETEET